MKYQISQDEEDVKIIEGKTEIILHRIVALEDIVDEKGYLLVAKGTKDWYQQ